MKQFFYAILCLLNVNLCAEKTVWVWAYDVMAHNPTDEEITLILNFLYHAYARSEATKRVQEACNELLQNIKKIVTCCYTSRMNPNKLPYYDSILDESGDIHTHFIEAVHYHQIDSATYARCVNYIIDTHALRPALEELVQELRQQCRVATAQALNEHIDVRQAYDTIKKIMCTKRNALLEQLQIEEQELELENVEAISRGLLDYVYTMSPYFALQSFVQFDKRYNEFNEALWETLLKSYALNGVVWHALETTRADFFKEHYRALSAVVAQQRPGLAAYTAFDPHGYVPSLTRKYTLMTPTELVTQL